MLKTDRPSDLFIAAIRAGFAVAETIQRPVTCSAIWDQVVMQCLRKRNGFIEMFAWDHSRARTVNRIGTIQECIARELVPGLRLMVEHGHYVVYRC